MKTNLKRISKRSLALILGILMLFSTLMVGSISNTNAADYGSDSVIFHSGETIYYDLTEYYSTTTNDNKGADILKADGTFSEYKGDTSKIISVKLTSDLTITTGSSLFQTAASSWNAVKCATLPTSGQNMIVSPDGNTASWSTYTPTYRVVGDSSLCGSGNNWDEGGTSNPMTANDDGTYTKVFENVSVGTYKFKIAKDGNYIWEYNDRTVEVTDSQAPATVTITYNPNNTSENYGVTTTVTSSTPTSYTISTTPNNSTISGLPESGTATAGQKIEFTVTVESGYQLDSVTMNGTTLTLDNGKYSFDMPSQNVTIVVNTSEIVNPVAGSVSLTADPATVETGNPVTLTAACTDPVDATIYYNLTKTSGPECTWNAENNTWTFTPATAGTYKFKATVSAEGYTDVDSNEVTVTVTAPASEEKFYLTGSAVGGWGGDKFIELTKNGDLYTKTFSSETALAQNTEFMLYNAQDLANTNRVNATLVSSDSVTLEHQLNGFGEQNIKLSLKSGYTYPIEVKYNKSDNTFTASAVKYYNITTSASHATVYVDSQALAEANVEFSVIASSGYKITGVSIDGAAQTLNDTNTYSFKMPEKDVEIKVTTERNADVPINKYYICGNIDGTTDWNSETKYKPLTVSEDGYYEYYQTSQNAEFLIADSTESTANIYRKECIDSLFNGTNIAVTTVDDNNNVFVNDTTANHYIIVYYPNTVANNTDAPKICAATELPNGINKTVEIIAKDGSKIVDPNTVFAKTTISSENFTSDITENDNNKRANIKVGNSVEITTTIPDGYKETYFVKGWCVNGKTYGLNADNTVSVDGSYTFTLPVTPGLDINDKIEITPVFFVATESATESKYITFYVEGFDDTVKKTWGDTIACYSYYYVNGDKANGTNRLLGDYPGQPLLADSTGRYFMQVAKADNDGNAISGITMSSYGSDSIHSEVTGVGNLQTYDYDDFSRIVEANPNATNIVFSFKLREGNNSPAASYATDEDMLAAGVTNFEDLKTYNGSMSNIFYDAIDVTANTPVLYVVSNGYDGSSVIGEFPTSWYVYTKGSDGVYTKLATLPPSALVYNTSDDLQKSTLSEYLSAYKALEDYKEYAVKISYEGNNAPPAEMNKGDVKRCDGKWYFTETGAPISSNIIIQYEDKDNRGTYKPDTFGANGLGENTGANAFFTNAEASDHLYETTVDNNDTYNFSAYAYATTYKFVGWYVASTDGGEPTLITTSTEGEATRNANFTFIARYEYVDQSLTLNLEYKFMEYNGSSISYDSKYDGSSDEEHTYSKSTTVLETVVTDSAALKDLVKRLAPIIQSDYYDYTLNESSIKVSYNAQTGIVSATASYDDTPHIYTVSVNGELIHGYYQNIITLNSMDFVDFASLDECATKGALWYYVNPDDSTDSVLYYDKPALDYRFVVDGAILDVVKGDGTSLDGTSNIVNSYYELISEGVDTGASSTHKLTQNFYITDYLDYAYAEDGTKLDNTDYVNYLGGGIIFFGSDKDGNLVSSKKDYEDKANRRDLIKSIVGDGKADISRNEGGIGCLYTLYSAHPDQYRYSNALLAYQSIKSIVVNNTSANDGRYFTAYSFFVYEYELSDGTKGTTFSLSDNGATANAYIPVV